MGCWRGRVGGRRARRRGLGWGAVLGALAVPLAPVPTGASTVGPPLPVTRLNASQLYQASVNALQAQQGVGYRSVVSAGANSDTTVVQAGPASGWSTVAVREGKLAGHIYVIFVGSAVFVKGDQHGLQSVNFSAKVAAEESGHWVEVLASAGDARVHSVFQVLSATLTIPTVVSGIALAPPLRLSGAKMVLGRQTLAIKGYSAAQPGPPPGTEELYVRDAAVPLPVEAVITGSGLTVTVDFTSWGKAPVVRAPRGAVEFQKSWLNTK